VVPSSGSPGSASTASDGVSNVPAIADKNTTTLVSAFYPLDSKHSVSHYATWMEHLFALQDNMIIFTNAKGYPTVSKALEKSKASSVAQKQQQQQQQQQQQHDKDDNSTAEDVTGQVKIVILELNETDTAQMFTLNVWKEQNRMDPERRIHKTYEVGDA
jgi:hypothetical protein